MGKIPPKVFHIDRRAGQLVAQFGDEASSNLDDLLTTEAVAEWLGVSKQFLEIRRGQNNGPPFKRISPRKIMYLRSDVLAWLRRRTFASTKDYPKRRAAR
jgi:hypothetical protein